MNPLLVFDLDGTLVDSAPDIIRAVNRTLANHSKPTLSDEVIISHIGEGLKKLIADLFKNDNLDPGDIMGLEHEFLQIYEEEMFTATSIFPGVERFLAAYPGPMAIVTNKNEGPAKALLSHLGLDRFPWIEVFGADSLAERKPSPLPLQTVMRIAGHHTRNTFMIGDGIPDMVSAQRAEVPSIAISFGYTSRSILETYSPKAFLPHYDELGTLIKKLTHI